MLVSPIVSRIGIEILDLTDLLTNVEVSSSRSLGEDLRRGPDEDEAEVDAERREEKYRVLALAVRQINSLQYFRSV